MNSSVSDASLRASQAVLGKRMTWLWISGGIVAAMAILMLVAGILTALLMPSHPYRPKRDSISNARRLGLSLFEFENDYGSYPNEETAERVKERCGGAVPLGNISSNDFLRQLIAADYTSDERMFDGRIDDSIRPDTDVTGDHALSKGECGFSYLVGLNAAGNPSRPLLMTPLIRGTDRFDPKPFDGKAIILRVDNSASALDIDASGHVLEKGMNILDPKHPIWGGHPYTKIAYPDL